MLEPALILKQDTQQNRVEVEMSCIPMGQIIAFLIPSTPDFIA